MKKVALAGAILLMAVLIGCTTLIEHEGGVAIERYEEYSEVIDVEGLSKDEIFAGIGTWLASTFKYPSNVVKQSDKDAGRIVIVYKSSTSIGLGLPVDFTQTVTIDIKDGRYKITQAEPIFDNQDLKLEDGKAVRTKTVYTAVMADRVATIAEIKAAVNKVSNDW